MPPPDATGGAGDPAGVGQRCKYHVISVAESDSSVLLQILACSCSIIYYEFSKIPYVTEWQVTGQGHMRSCRVQSKHVVRQQICLLQKRTGTILGTLSLLGQNLQAKNAFGFIWFRTMVRAGLVRELNELNWTKRTERRHLAPVPRTELNELSRQTRWLGNWTVLNWCPTALNFEREDHVSLRPLPTLIMVEGYGSMLLRNKVCLAWTRTRSCHTTIQAKISQRRSKETLRVYTAAYDVLTALQ